MRILNFFLISFKSTVGWKIAYILRYNVDNRSIFNHKKNKKKKPHHCKTISFFGTLGIENKKRTLKQNQFVNNTIIFIKLDFIVYRHLTYINISWYFICQFYIIIKDLLYNFERDNDRNKIMHFRGRKNKRAMKLPICKNRIEKRFSDYQRFI